MNVLKIPQSYEGCICDIGEEKPNSSHAHFSMTLENAPICGRLCELYMNTSQLLEYK